MLTVPVKLHRGIILMAGCVEVSSLHCAANPQVLHQMDAGVLVLPADLAGAVGGAVVNDDIIQHVALLLGIRRDLADGGLNVLFFIIGRNNQ